MRTISAHRSLGQMAIFARVVELQSFSRAADSLALSKSAVSKQVSELEAGLGVQLLSRSTRRLSLTEPGRAYYESCARVVAEAEAIERQVGELERKPLGTLRVNAPTVFGSDYVMPVVTEYLKAYEGVDVEVQLDDRYVDLVDAGVDVAVRIGQLPDSSLVARRVASIPIYLVASPDYLARSGVPKKPGDLRTHDFITYSLAKSPHRLVLSTGGRRRTVSVAGRIRANSGAAIRSAVVGGHGIASLPAFYIARDLAEGRAVRLLESYSIPSTMVHAVCPAGRHMSTKVRRFIDLLASRLRGKNGCLAEPPER